MTKPKFKLTKQLYWHGTVAWELEAHCTKSKRSNDLQKEIKLISYFYHKKSSYLKKYIYIILLD